MNEDTPEIAEPANLKLLRRLVTLLLITMIAGFVILITLFALRFTAPTTTPAFKDVELPNGAKAVGYSEGDNWFAITTDQEEILIFNLDNSLRQTIKIKPQ